MLGKILTVGTVGLDCYPVEVEADVCPSTSKFFIVGLADTMVQEAKERVRAACDASGVRFPRSKVVINLAPADKRKEGSWYDLPIALSVLAFKKEIVLSQADSEAIFIGELSLTGEVRPVKGILNMIWNLRRQGFRRFYFPAANRSEAEVIDQVELYPVSDLKQLIQHVRQKKLIEPIATQVVINQKCNYHGVCFEDIHGQEQAKRLLEIAAAGGHNVLLTGSPGAGKTLLAKSIISLLPPMPVDESMEVSRIYSYAGLLPTQEPLLWQRPFRSPHHSSSQVSLVGGGSWPKPGEITLAHRGVLFLDELPEFPRPVLDALRQPLEDKIVHIARAQVALTFPASFILIAAANPCTCGYYGSQIKTCVCRPSQVMQYQRRISGPLLDRIDLFLEVTPVPSNDLLNYQRIGETSEQVRRRVAAARNIQFHRYVSDGYFTNAETGNQKLQQYCQLDNPGKALMERASTSMELSSRAVHKIIKVARTIADLAAAETISRDHLLEALQFRRQ